MDNGDSERIHHGVMVALNPMGRVLMQRDMELVRAIFANVQGRKDVSARPVEIAGYEEWLVQRHVELLVDSGFVDAVVSRPMAKAYPIVLVRDLTWQGHDFAATLANEGVWTKIKQSFSPAELAGLPLAVVKDVGMKLLAVYAMQKLGLKG